MPGFTDRKGTWFAGAVSVTLVVAACNARRDELADPPRDDAVQLVDDGNGPRRVAAEPLVRSRGAVRDVGNLGNPTVSVPQAIAPRLGFDARSREHARIRALAQTRPRVSVTIAPASLAPWLASIGARSIETSRAAGDVRAAIPADRIEELLARRDVVRIASEAETYPTATWNGLELQDALGTARLRAVGLDGSRGGRTPGGVKIGIVEVDADRGNWPVLEHPGWNGRLVAVRDCQLEGCPVVQRAPMVDPFLTTHGTTITWIAAGSIEGGQDAAFPGEATAAQRMRSGNLGGATIVFYGANGSDAVARAVDRAVEDGIDVVNMSLTMGRPGSVCDPEFDPSGFAEHMRAALDAGVVLVAAAGNSGEKGCSVGYPAFRPEVISVGALESGNDSTPYASLAIWDEGPGRRSGRGRVDLVAPGCMAGFFTRTSSDGDRYFMGPGGPCGTSISSPAVAALLGALGSALHASDAQIPDGRSMIAQALLLGDGWDPDAGVDAGAAGMSAISGAGRASARWPGSDRAPSGWGYRRITIHEGETITWRVGRAASAASTRSHWRWALAQTPASPDAVPAIDFHVDDLCTSSVIASDTTHDARARLGVDADVACLRMRAYGARIPPEGATFYSADAHEAR